LRSDSWRTIESANPWRCEFEASCFAIYFNGVYWWGKTKGLTTTILALDVGGGILRKVSLRRYLGVLGGCITLVCRKFCDQNVSVDIWVTEGDGAVDSCWSKLQTIEHSSPCV
jgi:hypothetical protein